MLVLTFDHSWKVSMPDRALFVFRQQSGDLCVMDNGKMRRVVVQDVEWWMGLAKNCETYAELADYSNWK